jgi:multidrug efflux pump subunit AcrA (membrane-fusion protein)
MKKKILYGLISLVIISLALGFSAYLINAKPIPKKDNNKEKIMYVKTQRGQFTEMNSDMVYRGRITAFDNVSLAAEVSGRLMQGDVRFKIGESFSKNDVIIKIYSENVEAALKSGKSSFLQTVSKILPDLKVDYKDQYDKWISFFNAINPEKTLPELPEIYSDKERVFLASNNVLSNYYSLKQQQINLKRYIIHAPFNGSFKSVNKEIGAVASPGAELATIIRSDKLEVVVPVFPKDLVWIKKGDKVLINDSRGLERTATVSRISGFVDEATQSVNVYLTYIASGSNSFLEGEYVDVNFKSVKVSGFQIPREALVDNYFVYELSDNKLRKLKVEIVRTLNDSFIVSGIDSTNTIVTESLASINSSLKYMAR